MSIGEQLYQAAADLIRNRYSLGWGGAASIRLATGDILTSVSPKDELDGLSVCMELGAILEAHRLDRPVTHSLCLYREDETSPLVIQSPCGICQERLRFWGPEVHVAITNGGNEIVFKTLRHLQPHHWSGSN